MADLTLELLPNKKVYFASDFHLGLSSISKEDEIQREKKIIRWLDLIQKDAQAIFLVGDIFDFWHEYSQAVPKGFIRFLGKIASLQDHGISVYFFTGNHDLWMYDYFQEELGVKVYTKSIKLKINQTTLLVGHGDGLGPGDRFYKVLKLIFTNKIAQWLFKWVHPDIGIRLAKSWSKSSRLKNSDGEDKFLGDKEYLIQHCKKVENETHHDFYIFGHRHLPLEIDINSTSKYYNLGEWVNQFTYGAFAEGQFSLNTFEKK